ncbi:inactive dipeptidyl peptidase 10 [Hetaerina americana]|uniref:inactive dipeptidyl peptidase 10 n=1 Tax=Hetaerina americana TaxID=62018 RepID=UPI003A7F2CA7
MHTNVNIERNSWRLPPDETVQVADPRSKKEDLSYGPGEGRNWRSVLLSLLVIGLVVAGVGVAIHTLGYVDELLYWSGRRMRLQELLGGELTPRRLPLTWVLPPLTGKPPPGAEEASDAHLVFHDDFGGLSTFDSRSGTISQLVSNHTLRQLDVQGYYPSADLRYVLFRHNVKTVFRNTFTAHYTVYDVQNDHHLPVRLNRSKVRAARLQYAGWMGQTEALIFVSSNDIYLRQSPLSDRETRLTHSGRPGILYNGVPDWLYQEDLFADGGEVRMDGVAGGGGWAGGCGGWAREALWPSRTGKRLLYASFDDSSVGQLAFPWFSSPAPSAPTDTPDATTATTLPRHFPDERTVRYPTPGTPNPEVTLWVMDLADPVAPQRSEVKPPAVFQGQEYYLMSAQWVGGGHTIVSAVWMNRAQNLSVAATCVEPEWSCVETHAERALEEAWVEVRPPPVFPATVTFARANPTKASVDSFLVLAPVQEGTADHFTHIKHVSLAPADGEHLSPSAAPVEQRISVLSHGRYEVMRIIAWDDTRHLVYYLATHDSNPGQRHLYVVRDPGSDDAWPGTENRNPRCLTCYSAKSDFYKGCAYFEAHVSLGIKPSHVTIECLGPGLPRSGVHALKDPPEDFLTPTVPIYSEYHRRRMQKGNAMGAGGAAVGSGGAAITDGNVELALPTSRTYEVTLSQGARAQVQLLLPPSWREELRDAAFPVLVEVNGRPGVQSVSERWRVDWGNYMSSRNDVVYIRLDVRGAAGQGRRALRPLYRRLGGVEVQDQVTALRHLLDNLKYLDETRVGLWGWGYGGYVTTMVLGSQQNVFKCGVAVSPIADWLHYNSAFTERVLGAPSDNYKGYVEADATRRAAHVPHHALFLLHGLADDSAPFAHGVALARALADAGVLFRYQSYADEGHALTGVLEHAYGSMEDFLKGCLSLDEEESP